MKNVNYFLIVFALLFSCNKEDLKWNLDKVVRLPKITTGIISNITNISAFAIAEITSDGGASVKARGVCWSTNQNPTIADNITNNGTGSGSFTSSLSSLNSNTTYYVRAYATNSVGTAYGNQINFTTTNISGSLSTLTTASASGIANNSAISGGNITSDGGASVTARGVCWSTNQNPTIADNITNNGTGSGSFTSSLSSLNANTTYYARAYATNGLGTAYGNQINFTTLMFLPNNNCQISQKTTGLYYTIQINSKSYFIAGENITLTMISPTYKFGQASAIRLYDGDNQISSFGNFLIFTDNSRTLTLPTSLNGSNCYNIHVMDNVGDVYVTNKFTIIP